MEKKQSNRSVRAGSSQKKVTGWVFVLCLLLGGGIMISSALLGSSLCKFSKTDVNTINLIPPTQAVQATGAELATNTAQMQTQGSEAQTASVQDAAANAAQVQAQGSEPQTTPAQDAAANTAQMQAQGSEAQTTPAQDAAANAAQVQMQGNEPQTAPAQKVATDIRQVQASGATVADDSLGDLQVYDDTKSWSTETQVDLFQDSYDGTVKSENGDKVVAPGTSKYYTFTVKNNGDLSLDYKIALQVETHAAQADTVIPLEWRLLADDGALVRDWQNYSDRTEILKESTLSAKQGDLYTIEWRWQFERGEEMDVADTNLGNQAAQMPFAATATIIVHAEQNTNENDNPSGDDDKPEPDGPGNKPDDNDNPQTDDPANTPDDNNNPQTDDPANTPDDGDNPRTDNPANTPGDGDNPQTDNPANVPGDPADDATSSDNDTPQTGDRANPLLYLVLLMASALGLLVVVILPARRKKDEDRQHGQT